MGSSWLAACTALEAPDDDFGRDAGQAITASPFDPGEDAGLDRPSPVPGCPPVRERPVIALGDEGANEVELDSDEAWTCTANYLLASPVFLAPGVTLAIGPDTRVLARPGSYLLAQRGARLVAAGTRAAPVVFGSAEPAGQRAPGDWRGVLLAGYAPSHVANAALPGTLSDPRAHYGGGPGGDPTHDCGQLRFVRIEFAGGSTDEEASPSAALSLGGCGAATSVDFVQIHRATDGLGLLGGTVEVRHLVVSNGGLGNAVEWAFGYTGRMQHVVAQGSGTGAAFKGSNSASDPSLSPVSHPVIFNATAVGIRPILPSGAHYGVALQHGSAVTLRNSIVTSFGDGAISVESAPTIAAVSSSDVSHLTLFDNGADGVTHLPGAAAALQSSSLRERDPGLRAARLERPSFAPGDAGVQSDVAVTPVGFDPGATYRGALPFEGEDWTLDWTEYPVN